MFSSRKSNKLLPIISVLLVTGFVLTSLASYFVSRESLRSKISLKELPLTIDNIYSEIQRDLFRPVMISSMMATDTFLRDWVIGGEVGEQYVIRYLSEIKDRYRTFTSFFVSESTRIYYHSNGILKTVSPENERDVWYFRVRDMKDDFEINVDPDMANKDMMTVFINYRVFDYDNKYIGATGVGLTVSAVKNMIEFYQQKYKSTIYFIDNNGEVKLSGSNFDDTVNNISQFGYFSTFKDNLELADHPSFTYKKGGELIHTNIRYIDEVKWYLVVEQSEHESIKKIFTTLVVNLIICIAITTIILLLVSLSIKAYTERIETLRGIVPICSFCKQIRDDKGYWNRVEEYVSKYTEAEFSHGICPECVEKHYPGYGKVKSNKKNNRTD